MRTIRLGIAGLGKRAMGYGLVPAFKRIEGLAVTAVCEPQTDKLEQGLDRLRRDLGGEIAGFGDHEAFAASGLMDAVYIAAPNYLHCEVATAALGAGLDVLVEKPMATRLDDCDKMIAAARRGNRVLGVGMQMNYRMRYHKVTELIDAGRIGEPTMLSCVEYRKPFADTKRWVWERAKSGGAIVEKNCHHYGLLDVWAKGQPRRVFATGGQKAIKEVAGCTSELIDNAYVTCDYDSGARSLVVICFLAGEHCHQREFVVIGTKGRIWFNHDDNETIHLHNTHTGEKEDFRIDEEARGGLFADFLECVRDRRDPLVTGEHGRNSLVVPIAAQTSLETGLPVDVTGWARPVASALGGA